MRSPRDLISDNLQLISLPELVLKLNRMVDDPRYSANDIANVILQDMSLSAHLLRIANSAFYSLPSKVESVSMAVTLIGTRQLKDMILATSVVNHFRAIPDNLVPIGQFWQHNIACATACHVIARFLNQPNLEVFFLAGLLHDIGKMVMYHVEPALSAQVITRAASSNETLNSLETQLFGFNHCEVGAELLRHWEFPDSLVEPVLYHHSPANAQQFQVESATVHLGNAIANTLTPALSLDDDLPIDPNVWHMLGLSEDILNNIIRETQDNLAQMVDMLYAQAA